MNSEGQGKGAGGAPSPDENGDVDRMSGRWIRDQLGDLTAAEASAGSSPSEPPSPGGGNPFMGVAESLSRAVTEPMVRLSRQYEEERGRLEAVIGEQNERISALSAALKRMEDQLARNREEAAQQLQALQQALDATGASLRRDTEDLSAKATELERSFQSFDDRAAALEQSVHEGAAEVRRNRERERELAELFRRAHETLAAETE